MSEETTTLSPPKPKHMTEVAFHRKAFEIAKAHGYGDCWVTTGHEAVTHFPEPGTSLPRYYCRIAIGSETIIHVKGCEHHLQVLEQLEAELKNLKN